MGLIAVAISVALLPLQVQKYVSFSNRHPSFGLFLHFAIDQNGEAFTIPFGQHSDCKYRLFSTKCLNCPHSWESTQCRVSMTPVSEPKALLPIADLIFCSAPHGNAFKISEQMSPTHSLNMEKRSSALHQS